MVECDYCGADFADEAAYHEHLAGEHEGELGPIDRRKVGDAAADEGGLPTGPLVLAGVLLGAAALVAYVVLAFGGGVAASDAERTPDARGTAHEHGTMEVTIAGERLDFSRERFQRADERFHFENGDGRVWHTHATGVTLEYALATLGVEATSDSVTHEGNTYVDGERANVTVAVNGESVDPTTYVLEGVPDPTNAGAGDHVVVEATITE